MVYNQVLIMAAGDATRYFGVEKQLMKLPNGERVIDRLVRQVKDRGYTPIVVTHNEAILRRPGIYIVPEKRDTLCDSILSAGYYWGMNSTIVLLGDVVFTDDAIDTVFKRINIEDGPIVRFYGNDAEIYALRFGSQHNEWIARSLEKASKYRFGKLRYAYKVMCELPIDGPELEDKILVWIRDETNDIDSHSDYDNMIARWNHDGNQPGY